MKLPLKLVGKRIEDIVLQKYSSRNQCAIALQEKIGYQNRRNTNSFLAGIFDGYIYGLSNSPLARNEKNLNRLTILLNELEISENDEIVTQIKTFDNRFQYPSIN